MHDSEPRLRERELLPLTDSLASRVRWRLCDYAAIFNAELDLMLRAEPGSTSTEPTDRSPIGKWLCSAPELRSQIHVLDVRLTGRDESRRDDPAPRTEPRE